MMCARSMLLSYKVTHDKSEIEKANKIFEVKKAFLDEKRSCQ